jgi:hypothetical protein
MDVQANADHGIALIALAGSFNQDAAKLSLITQQIIGPFQLDVFAKRLSHAQSDCQGKARPIAGLVG